MNYSTHVWDVCYSSCVARGSRIMEDMFH
uniref:Uncharacterized protein n=1 Tax=Anguilla anguilla TaxID=7936 RepID=A0A0E9TM94_ANGAN